jgi:hypothetical protein
VSGTIDGRALEPKAIYLHYSNANSQWFFTIDNYDNDCGTMKDRPDPATAMVVTIGKVEPKAGSSAIAYADGHGATFQVGVYDTTNKATTYSVKSGTLRFDTWNDNPGTQIGGALKLASDEGEIEGTFLAKVCAPL